MPRTRRARLTVLAAAGLAVAALPAVALASAPKVGYYIDAKQQTYVQLVDSGTVVKLFQSPCLVTPQGGGPATQQGGFALKKHLKVSAKGKFSYSGNTKLQTGSSDATIHVKVAGTFARGKVKGTIAFDGTSSYCNNVSFSGKNYGTHPQG